MGAGSGERWSRWSLLIFGGLFAVLFLGLAIEVGVGSPHLPSGALVVVEGAAPGTGTISRAELEQAMLQSAFIAGQKQPPRPSEKGYEQAKSEALDGLIIAIWLRGEAEEMGIVVSGREVAAQLQKTGEAQTRREEGFTRKTTYERVRGEMLVQRIEEALADSAKKPSPAEVKIYYEEELSGGEETAAKKPFSEARAEAEAELEQVRKQEVFSEFDATFPEAWQPRTHCAAGFVVDKCEEFRPFTRLASSGCGEEGPKTSAEGCPAPVPQRLAALPGSVTPFKAGGEAFVQRPYPEVVEGETSGD
jgi:hypothetical protein